MKTMNMKIRYIILTAFISLIAFSCDDSADNQGLRNDCLKRSISPNIVGEKIEFAYAMAIPPGLGKLQTVEVNSTIAGAAGTMLDPNSYYTSSGGQDVGVLVAEASTLDGASCTTRFVVDTCAATLRYYYVIPEEARGRTVSFTFNVTASNGETRSYRMGEYNICKMSMKRNLALTAGDRCYISVSDEAVYTRDEIAANPALAQKIDLVYAYSSHGSVTHALFSPTAPPDYLSDTYIPSGANAATALLKTWGLRDQQLSGLQWAVFVDDRDFLEQDFSHSSTSFVGLKAENGIWVETTDKSQRAYIYINSVGDKKMTISMKRYVM